MDDDNFLPYKDWSPDDEGGSSIEELKAKMATMVQCIQALHEHNQHLDRMVLALHEHSRSTIEAIIAVADGLDQNRQGIRIALQQNQMFGQLVPFIGLLAKERLDQMEGNG